MLLPTLSLPPSLCLSLSLTHTHTHTHINLFTPSHTHKHTQRKQVRKCVFSSHKLPRTDKGVLALTQTHISSLLTHFTQGGAALCAVATLSAVWSQLVGLLPPGWIAAHKNAVISSSAANISTDDEKLITESNHMKRNEK